MTQQTGKDEFLHPCRSNNLFQKRGLEKLINSEICLSTSRNPDFVTKHPNELEDKNKDWKRELIKRVTHQQEVRIKVLATRLEKKTGNRRISG